MRVAVTEEELTGGAILEQHPTGVSLIFKATLLEQSKKVIVFK